MPKKIEQGRCPYNPVKNQKNQKTKRVKDIKNKGL